DTADSDGSASGDSSDSDDTSREHFPTDDAPESIDAMSLKAIALDDQLSVKLLADGSPSLKLGQISPTQKSRLQNRMNHHSTSQNRISSFSHQNQRGLEQNGADHVS
ncbi:MAG: hypothetical protein VKL39_08345, partial [Leptolyngbyaceae bacterium]|nr:hypothetical protein [Leptolyngbyaceae bacterium]